MTAPLFDIARPFVAHFHLLYQPARLGCRKRVAVGSYEGTLHRGPTKHIGSEMRLGKHARKSTRDKAH